ncbi:hypothetical protein A2W14_04420 [Candidatus Gottesmanbacteria bacterium RBG_16_37_8]|uniref:Phosphatidylglycerol--prolipoprotein diacylglyceryl transferase n=1 Tax=Candidatus Gottesmanbacteria bacterium RBG_16_37_8 TaxID=1798371 RepID=A0A1F5YSW1_9BACT|nr:MAG: hypothetical protein A2W14_04420 [Candidatus Gottesmanbacteria bacterium RBG_16_37_8]
MMPVLYTIGPFSVYSFGFFLALSFLLSTFVVYKLAREEFKEEEYLDAYFYTALITLVSARAVYIFRNWSDFQFTILKYILVVETPGLSLIGGVIGGFIFLYFYCKKNKIKFFHLLDILSQASALALVLIKIGQQLGGAAFGRETDFFLKIRLVGRPGFYHPTELYEAIIFLVLFIFLIMLNRFLRRRKLKDGIIFCVFAFFLGASVIGLEFLKVHHVYLYGLSFRQILALIIIIGSLTFLADRLNIFRKILNNFKKSGNEISQRTA